MAKSLKKIIWLASYPKSGNTWFRMFFSNLLSSSDEPVSINNIMDPNIASQRYLFDNYAGVNSSDLSEQEIGNLRPKVYAALAAELADTIFMKGPAGAFMEKGFDIGTKAILQAISEHKGYTVVGGGHSSDAIQKFKINKKKFGHISLSGGALLKYISGQRLCGLVIME